MNKINNVPRRESWLRAIAETAREANVPFPQFAGHAMGTARTEPVAGGRFVTFKRRLVSTQQAEIDGIEWALWQDRNTEPELLAYFRVPVLPTRDDVGHAFSLLKGWLVDGLTPHAMREAVATLANSHSRT